MLHIALQSQFSEAISAVGVETSPNGQIMEIPNHKLFSFLDLNSATKNFKSDTLLGEVALGKCAKVVAIKKLNPQSMQGFEEWQAFHFSLLFQFLSKSRTFRHPKKKDPAMVQLWYHTTAAPRHWIQLAGSLS